MIIQIIKEQRIIKEAQDSIISERLVYVPPKYFFLVFFIFIKLNLPRQFVKLRINKKNVFILF